MALDPEKIGRLISTCDALHKRMDAFATGKGKIYPGHGRPDGAFDRSMPAPTLPVSSGRPDSDFSKLENKLAHTKGVTSPAGLAAYIGRKELGQKEMTERSVEGRKDAGQNPDQLQTQERMLKEQLHQLNEQQVALDGERKAVNEALARLRPPK